VGTGVTGASITAGALPTGVTGSFAAGVFTISGTPTVAGTFNYTVTTSGGCAPNISLSGTIKVNPLSSITLTSAVGTAAQTICTNIGLSPIIYTAGSGVTSISITAGALPLGITGTFAGGTFTISGTPTLATPATYNYTVTTSGGCAPDVSLSGTIIVTPAPTIALTSATGTDNQNVCNKALITAISYSIGGSGTGANVTGLPTGITGVFATGVFTISGTPTVAGTFNYTVTTTGGCNPGVSLSGIITVIEIPDPKPIATPSYICVDANNIPISTSTIQTQLDDTNYTFVWSDSNGVIVGATQSFYIASVPDTYSVVATPVANNSCSSLPASVVISPSLPPLTVIATPSDYFADVQTITVTVTPAGNYEYQIDNGPFQTSNIFTNVGAKSHTITVTDLNHCGEISTTAYIVDYPRFFTPNSDGIHDTWNISSISDQKNAKVLIFDRFGKFLKEIRPSGDGWNGYFNGKELPSTDYWFVVTYEEKGITKELKSHFAMKR
ncbi:T9SS type B sorting domain-containing protein, partial [Flavobacterium sp.]|uniref:T9SS type B sorting domain-containing protein n=1 Tax=Flavobacterium sp. TaxID=239 RepID=UPI0038FC778D